jgi:hypothetical protein
MRSGTQIHYTRGEWAMADETIKKLSMMSFEETGFCSLDVYYIGPSAPIWAHESEGPTLPLEVNSFLRDADVCSEPSPQASLRVKRVRTGYTVKLASDFIVWPSLDHPSGAKGPLPVIAHEQ